MPGLLMGLLQIGWFAVGTFFATKFILTGLGLNADAGTPLFTVVAVIWGYTMAYIGAKGIHYVAKVALYLNGIAFLMVLVVFMNTSGGLGSYTVDPVRAAPFVAFTVLVQAMIGFFATAGAAGADFGMNARNEKDVRMGGIVGIALAIVYAGGLPILSVLGARALNPNIGLHLRRRDRSCGRHARIGRVPAVRGHLDSLRVLLRLHRGKQFLHDDPRSEAHLIDDGRRHGGHCARHHRCC
jgi:cytosine permease